MNLDENIGPIRLHIHDNISRYALGEINDKNILYCFGLNPSSATSTEDDPTIINVRKLAEYNNFNSWIMLNLYPQRSNNPNEVDKFNRTLFERNINEVVNIIQCNSTIWVAWGNNIKLSPFYTCFLELFGKINEKKGIIYKQLGNLTEEGHPRHPLYQSTTQYFNTFDFENYYCNIKQKYSV